MDHVARQCAADVANSDDCCRHTHSYGYNWLNPRPPGRALACEVLVGRSSPEPPQQHVQLAPGQRLPRGSTVRSRTRRSDQPGALRPRTDEYLSLRPHRPSCREMDPDRQSQRPLPAQPREHPLVRPNALAAADQIPRQPDSDLANSNDCCCHGFHRSAERLARIPVSDPHQILVIQCPGSPHSGPRRLFFDLDRLMAIRSCQAAA
jgi:hypothetical protein